MRRKNSSSEPRSEIGVQQIVDELDVLNGLAMRWLRVGRAGQSQ